MSIETDLKKNGIEVIKPLNSLQINTIARNVAAKLCKYFPEHGFAYHDLFMKLSRLNMYFTRDPENGSQANYFYKNSSIYFSKKLNKKNLMMYAIHECIHYLQEVKDKKNYLVKLGLCDFTEFKIYGMSLNEAAVQLAASKAVNAKEDTVKYYGITFSTSSPNYYPLQCNLVNQMAYMTGEYTLFNSTFFSNDGFKNKLIELCGEKPFYKIEKNLDIILHTEEQLTILNNRLQNFDGTPAKRDKLIKEIEYKKEKVAFTFIDTQNILMCSYFNKSFDHISNIEELENYRRKLYNYKNYIGTVDGYTFFNEYYINQMSNLEELYYILENGESVNALVPVRESSFGTIIRYLKKLIFNTKTLYKKENRQWYN